MKQIYLRIFILSLLLYPVFTQVSSGGEPKSMKFNLSSDISKIILPTIDKNTLIAEDELEMDKNIPYRFGTPLEVNLNLQNSGSWEHIDNGKIWRLSIESKHAFSINLLYNRFILPEGAEFFVYDENMETILGAFTNKNNKSHQLFSTSPTKGDITILEYFEPYDVEFNGEIQINRVVHAYKDVFFKDGRDYGDSGSCNNNVNCPEFSDWADEVRSVAMILTGGGWRLCTGSLLNNARQDLTPYFLTANHCLGGESSWIFMFQYESAGCNNQNGPTYMTVQGSTLLDNSSSSDFALLLLDENPPESYEVHYAGWDVTGNTPNTPFCVHHPSGDIKKITFDYDNAVSSGNYWDVNSWDDGTTEPGSSGSPLFEGINHRVVGQLYGGVASCTNWGYDTYGKLSSSWNYGLDDYLDPDNTGISFLDGIDAIDLPDPQLSYDADEFNFEMDSDENSSENFTISNIGEPESELNYTINTSPFETIGGGPDEGGYFWTDSEVDENINYDWINIENIGTLYNFPNNDSAGDWINIGFNFPFYGNNFNNDYVELFINPNGWIGFNDDDDAWDNTTIPTSAISGAAIFALWDDLNPVNDNCNQYCAGNVYYHTNAERMVIWFDQVAHWWSNFENTSYDFQIILYPSGKIDINYRTLIGDYDASVGIQGNSNTGSQVMYNTDDLSNNYTIAFNETPEWVEASPDQGTLLDGESQIISVSVNSINLDDGIYESYLKIVSSGGNATLPVTLIIDESSLLGDTNGDNLVNVLDVIVMVNMVLGQIEINLDTADLNEDGLVNILDVTLLLNIILNNI